MTRPRHSTTAGILVLALACTFGVAWSMGTPRIGLPEPGRTAPPTLSIAPPITASDRHELPGERPGSERDARPTLQLVHASTHEPIPDATVWFGKALQRTTNPEGRVLFSPCEQARALAPGYYIQSLEVRTTANGQLRAEVRPAAPLRGRVNRMPTNLEGHLLEVVWAYDHTAIPVRDQAMAYQARWSAAQVVDSRGAFSWQHLFPAAGELVLRARHRTSGSYSELARRRVTTSDAWVEFDLQGSRLPQRDAALLATLRFAPNTPTGRGQIELLDATGATVRFSNRSFERTASETSKQVTIDDLAPGTYTPRILFTRSGLLRLQPVRIVGRTVTELQIPSGGRLNVRVLGCGVPDLVKNPVSIHLRDFDGRICRTGYAKRRDGKIEMTAVAPGTYLAHATERRSGRVSRCQKLVVASGTILAPEFTLDEATRIRFDFTDQPTKSGTITIEDDASRIVQRTWMNNRFKRKTMRLPIGSYVVKTDFGTTPTRIVVCAKANNCFPIQLTSSR